MGKIFSSIFGGSGSKSKQQSSSDNQAYPYLQNAYGGQVNSGLGANNFIAQLLGLQGGSEADDAFGKYKDSTGYKFALDQGSKAITGNAASRGLLNSGATGKALTQFGQDTANQSFSSYLDKLLGLSGQGTAAGGLLAGAGNRSNSLGTSSSYSKPGMGQFIGSVMSSAAASDPRLKTDIVLVGENEGLNVYDFRYVWDKPGVIHRGYMADEVALTHPEALGPELPGGYKTLYYNRLPAIEGTV